MKNKIGPNQQYAVPFSIYQKRYGVLNLRDTEIRTGAHFNSDRGAFELKVLGFPLFASWPEFSLSPENAATCPRPLYENEARLLMLRYLLEGVNALPSGSWLPYRELPWGEVYDKNFLGRCIRRLAFAFGSRLNDFGAACEAVGGVKATAGDISYDLSFLPQINLRLTLWAGDDEFPPQAQWLFSDNTPLAFTAEDVACLGDVVINTLISLAPSKKQRGKQG